MVSRMVLTAVIGSLVLTLCALGGCQNGPDVGAEGRKAARNLGDELAYCVPLIEPALAGGKAKVAGALAGAFAQRARQGRPLKYGLAVLDAAGILVAAHYPEKGQPDGVAESQVLENYGNYEAVKTALNEDCITKAVLHSPQWGRIPVVCCPLEAGDKVAGLLVLVVDPEDRALGGGLDDECFMALDIPQPPET